MSWLNDLMQKFPVRRTKKEKAAFRDYIVAQTGGNVECVNGNNNVVLGDVKSARVVFTAHYDTPCTIGMPNLMLPRNKVLFFAYQMVPVFVLLAVAALVGWLVSLLNSVNSQSTFGIAFLVTYYVLLYLMINGFSNPHNANDNTSGVATVLTLWDGLTKDQRSDVAIILFDNEEKGKLGSKAYFKAHKDMMEDKLLVNLDCVGNGDNVLFIAKPKAEQSAEYAALKSGFDAGEWCKVQHFPLKGSEANSDYKSFPMGVCCLACKSSKKGILYTPYIHTPSDVVASEQNVQGIADGFRKYLTK